MTDVLARVRWGMAFGVLYAGLVVLYVYVAATAPGYDDEFHSIRPIERLGSGVIEFVAQRDVHPAGSYAADWALYSLLGEWSRVRMVIALLAVAAIIYAIERVRRGSGASSGLLAVALLGLNPAVLMWTTGVRWYALFVPVLLLVTFPPRTFDWRYWGLCFGGLLVLGYLSYAMFVVALPLVYLYWRADPRAKRVKTQQVVIFGLVFAILYAYQLRILFTEQLARSGGQRFSITESAIGFAVSELSNQGVFPLSAAGAMSIAGTLGIWAVIGLTAGRENARSNPAFIPYWLGVLLLFLSGLAGKARNFVVLAPWHGLAMSQAIVPRQWLRVFAAFAALVVAGNAVGVINVATHANTSKSSWNLPVAEAVDAVEQANQSCDSDIVVVAHDPTLTYVLEDQGYEVLSLWSTRTDQVAATERVPTCVVAVRTYAGSREATVNRLYAAVAAIDAESESTQQLGEDADFAVKQRLDEDYPQFQVEVVTLRNPTTLAPLQDLLPPAARQQLQSAGTP